MLILQSVLTYVIHASPFLVHFAALGCSMKPIGAMGYLQEETRKIRWGEWFYEFKLIFNTSAGPLILDNYVILLI